MVINLDESGFQDWADALKVKVIVPASYQGTEIPIPINRSIKRASLLAAITANGEALKPGVVVVRSTVEMELLQLGYTPENTIIMTNESGFFTQEHFEEWCERVLFTYIRMKRCELKYTGEAILIIDGFTGHSSDYILDRFTKEGVLPVFLAPHSSDQCQPLDLGIFGPQKKLQPSIPVPAGLSTQTAQLVKMLESFHKVATVRNITSAFRRAGIMSNYNKEKGYSEVTINCNEARKARHFNHTEKEPLSKTHFHLTHDVPPLPKIPFSECPEIRMATRRNEGPFI